MDKSFKQEYRVNKNAIEKSFEKQMGLKLNTEYEKWGSKTATVLIERFIKEYKGISIEIPKLREKSTKSLIGKIKNLEIERLSKLYAINEDTLENRKEFFTLIKERLNENKDLNIALGLLTLRNLLFTDKIDIDSFDRYLMIDGISKSTKTALLKVLVTKIEKSDLEKKNEMLDILEIKYGKKSKNAKINSKENDLIKYDAICELRNSEAKKQEVRNEYKYLKANDLRGMKIVVTDVPDDLETQNVKIKELLEKRSKCEQREEKEKLSNSIIVEIGKEFFDNIVNDKEFLEKNDIDILQGTRKYKKKDNGYEAHHIKFFSKKEPEYTLELQFKSEQVEEIAKGNGSASHQNRPGKVRILPKTNNDKELLNKLNFTVPKYTTFKIENGNVTPKKQSMLVNVLSYYEDELNPSMKEYDRIVNLYKSREREQ